MDATVYVQQLVNGLLVGGLYALFASGLNLIYGVMGVINLAHGEILILGGYIVYWLFALQVLNPPAGFPIAVFFMYVAGIVLHRALVERIVQRPMASMLVTLGVSMILVNLMLFFWTSNFRSVPYFTGSVPLGLLALSRPRLLAFLMACLIAASVYLVLKWTPLGKSIRGTSQNPELASACGIDVRRVRSVAFGLGCAMAGAAGALMSMVFAFNPETGQLFLFRAFAVVVLGGLGNFVGAFLGGLGLGVVEGIGGLYLTAQLSEAIAYILLILALLWRRTGQFGIR